MFQHTHTQFAVLFLFATTITAHSQADGSLRTVVLGDQQAPGLLEGVNFEVFGGIDFNNAGQVSLLALIQGPGFENRDNISIWDERTGRLKLVARVGERAPGSPEDVVFTALADPDIDDLGRTTFAAGVFGPSVTSPEDGEGIWRVREGGLERVGASSHSVVGLPDNTTWGVSGNPRVTSNGLLTVDAYTLAIGEGGQTGGVVLRENHEGIFSEIIRVSQQAPGYEDGASLSFVNFDGASTHPILINDLGKTVFTSEVVGPTRFPSAIFSDRSGLLEPVVREGDTVPGVDGDAAFSRFIANRTIRLGNSGDIVFRADIEGDDIRPGFDSVGIWSDTGNDGLQLIVQNRDPAPGQPEGVRFAALGKPTYGEPGQIYFGATVEGGGINLLDFVDGLWLAEGDDEPTLVFFEGDQAPAMPSGISLDAIGSPLFNDLGQYIIEFWLKGPGVAEGNDRGLWVASPDGILTPIIREGDLIDVNDDPSIEELRTIETFSQTQFNDRGEIAFSATFTDGTSGIFVNQSVAIPEPAAALLLASALFACIEGRQRCC